MSLLDKILRAGEGRELKKLESIARQVNDLEEDFVGLTDDELRAKTAEYQERYREGETLDELLPEAFATVREAAKRTLGQRHYDVQIMGGAALHRGNIAEMKTGEGKTLVATLPSYLNALSGDTFISCYPNAGLPNPMAETGFDETPAITSRLLAEFAQAGFVNIVGGCCGTTPEHIAAIAQRVSAYRPRSRHDPLFGGLLAA